MKKYTFTRTTDESLILVKVHAYDLIANGVLTEIDGVLGLDFSEGYKFCIDLVRKEISITLSSKN